MNNNLMIKELKAIRSTVSNLIELRKAHLTAKQRAYPFEHHSDEIIGYLECQVLRRIDALLVNIPLEEAA